MKFSIITPSFNGGKYLRQCLQSVQDQNGVEYEHIVQDAGSTDDTAAIVKDFPKVQFFSEPDKGMSDGINKGVLKATGNWWMWLNTDDYLLPNALKAVSSFIEKHPEADVVYGAWNFVDADGKFKRSMKALPFSANMLIEYGCYIASTATFYKKSSTVGVGELLNVNFKYVMDGEYYARLGRQGKKFLNFNAPLAEFRQHEGALSCRRNNDKTIDAALRRQYQYSEPAAIRRTYGFSPFKNDRWNAVSDSFLYEIYRLKKGMLKITTRWDNGKAY